MREIRVESSLRARQIAESLLAIGREAPVESVESVAPAPAPRPAIDYPRLQHQLRWFDGVLRLYRAMAGAFADQVVIGGRGDEPGERSNDRRGEGSGAGPVIGAVGAASAADDPAAGDDERLMAIVRRAHRILLEHPVAAKAAYTALAEQGRAFAATPDGAALRARLVRSRRLRRASLVWRALTMGMLEDDDPGELPATYLENLLRVVDRADLEALLGRLHTREPR